MQTATEQAEYVNWYVCDNIGFEYIRRSTIQ